MGWKLFETMASQWPTATGPFSAPMNEIPKAVFTKKRFKGIDRMPTSPAEASWAEARVFDGDLAEEIKEIKAASGKPIVAIYYSIYHGLLVNCLTLICRSRTDSM